MNYTTFAPYNIITNNVGCAGRITARTLRYKSQEKRCHPSVKHWDLVDNVRTAVCLGTGCV